MCTVYVALTISFLTTLLGLSSCEKIGHFAAHSLILNAEYDQEQYQDDLHSTFDMMETGTSTKLLSTNLMVGDHIAAGIGATPSRISLQSETGSPITTTRLSKLRSNTDPLLVPTAPTVPVPNSGASSASREFCCPSDTNCSVCEILPTFIPYALEPYSNAAIPSAFEPDHSLKLTASAKSKISLPTSSTTPGEDAPKRGGMSSLPTQAGTSKPVQSQKSKGIHTSGSSRDHKPSNSFDPASLSDIWTAVSTDNGESQNLGANTGVIILTTSSKSVGVRLGSSSGTPIASVHSSPHPSGSEPALNPGGIVASLLKHASSTESSDQTMANGASSEGSPTLGVPFATPPEIFTSVHSDVEKTAVRSIDGIGSPKPSISSQKSQTSVEDVGTGGNAAGSINNQDMPIPSNPVFTTNGNSYTAVGNEANTAAISGVALSLKDSPATVSHHTVSADPVGILASSKTNAFPPVVSDSTQVLKAELLFTIRGKAYTAYEQVASDSATVAVIGAQNFGLGEPGKVIDGQTVSLGSSGLIIASSTAIWETAGLSRQVEDARTFTVSNGHTLIATETTNPAGAAEAIVNSQTFGVGGAAVTLDGETLSLGHSGVIVDGSDAITWQTTPIISSETKAVLTIDDSAFTAVETNALAGAPAAVANETTLSGSGPAATIHGETISVASVGLVINGTRTASWRTETALHSSSSAGTSSIIQDTDPNTGGKLGMVATELLLLVVGSVVFCVLWL